MDKKSARIVYREKRMQLEARERDKLDDLILIQFQKLPLPVLQRILSYVPIAQKNEPATALCTRFLSFRYPGLELCYPRTNMENWSMQAVLIDDDTAFKADRNGLQEPAAGEEVNAATLDLVLVPLLIMDREGYRVGFGKGYYDRFLPLCRPDCIKVGLSYFEPIEKIEDRGEFDVPLNFGVTPGGIYVF